MQHHGSIVSPVYETERHMPTNMRGRKLSSTGGNRSWSEEEENYLLQTRMQKMPYKHIAAHLKKTELACRLHYHQLSHGSHRRKRTSSVSSHASSGSTGTSPVRQYAHTEHDEYSLDNSRQCSPISYAGQTTQYASVNASPNRSHHKILLPKPRQLTPGGSPEPPRLRINTHESILHPQGSVDTDRLRAIYETRRASFWASIAAEYGANVTPAQLEEIWRNGSSIGARPLTPDASPDGSISNYPHYPTLKPSPFVYQAQTGMDASKMYSPIAPMSAVSAPERMPFVLPQPTPTMGSISRSSTWSSSSNVPIAALLTEDKNPRGQEVSMRE